MSKAILFVWATTYPERNSKIVERIFGSFKLNAV
jgi:hypothetical protein